MLKFVALVFFTLSSLPAMASSPVDHILSVKERLRIHLWLEGITPVKTTTKPKTLPEEIERALRKM
jgi:hypothetical protein